jgi:hypothetical protein
MCGCHRQPAVVQFALSRFLAKALAITILVFFFCVFVGGASAQTYRVNSYELPTNMADQSALISDAFPHITGITVPLSWALIDSCSTTTNCTPGNYHWTTFDNSLAPYIASTCSGSPCQINFEVNAASGSSPNSATPSYVLTSMFAFSCCGSALGMDVCFCPNYPGSGVSGTGCQHSQPPDATGVPAAWEPEFIYAYKKFITEVITHYGSVVSWSSQVGYIRFGIGTGGGGVIPCPAQETTVPTSAPLNLAGWSTYADTIFSWASAQSPPMIIEGSGYGGENVTITTAWADVVAAAAISNGAGYGVESLAVHDQTLYAAGSPCSNDWCNSFNTYFIQSPPMLGLQTISISDPSCTSDPGASQTCSLVYVLPFGTERHANAFELAYEDMLCAYESGYGGSTCTVGSATNGYAAAIANALAGKPNGTAAVAGRATITGQAAVQ